MENTEINAWDTVSIHGTKVNRIDSSEDTAVLHCSSFWLLPEHQKNGSENAVSTTEGTLLTVNGLKKPLVTVVKRKHIIGDAFFHWAKNIKWDEFVQNVNSGEWLLELDTEDRPVADGVVYDGFIWRKDEKYSWDIRFSFRFSQTLYEWNDVDSSRMFLTDTKCLQVEND